MQRVKNKIQEVMKRKMHLISWIRSLMKSSQKKRQN
jgi:hypothetical protein